jgi:lipopolysaccharide transport protein LptA
MLLWMLYIVIVSVLLSGAALAAERIAMVRRAPMRWLWVVSIAASALVPTIIASAWVHVPRIPYLFAPTVSLQFDSLTLMAPSELSPSAWVGSGAKSLSDLPRLNTLLAWVWAGASCTLLLALVVSGAHLHQRKRHWEHGNVAGASVYITDNVGPAIVGLLHPRIAVPRWLTQATAQTQELVVAHEKSHLEAHDVRIFTGALTLLVAMPWNLPLWWQLRRLRFAIEVDCDARVLQAVRDARIYGETLIKVGQRQSGYVGSVAGMSEPRTFLERRLDIMMRKPAGAWRLSTMALGCSSLALVAAAAQIEPPYVATGLELQQGLVDREARIRSDTPEITYDAASMAMDNETHVMHLKDVTITFGNISVKADRALATAGDFKDTRWMFDGNVRINANAQGNLHSDKAVVEFQDNQLKRATVTGSPAEFDHKRRDSGVVTRGHADEIVYEAGPGTVRLSNAYITDGKNELNGPLIVYSVRK